MKKLEHILYDIEALSEEERSELLKRLAEKHPDSKFVVGENYNFWFDGADDDYDNI